MLLDGSRPLEALLSTARIAVVAVLLLGAAPAEAGSTAEAYRVVEDRDVADLERRLQSVAELGYEAVGASEGRSGMIKSSPIRVHLTLVPEQQPRRSYRLLESAYPGKLEKRLNAVVAAGYRLRPDGLLKRTAPRLMGRGDDESIVLLTERDGRGPPYEYRVLELTSPKRSQRRLSELNLEGFRFTAMREFYGGWVLLVMERPVIEQPQERQAGQVAHYLLLDDPRRAALYERAGEAVARGYRIVAAAAGGFGRGGAVMLLEHVTSAERPYAYLSLNPTDVERLEERLNHGAARGFRFHAQVDSTFDLLMERAPDAGAAVSYRSVSFATTSRAAEVVAAASAEGYRCVGTHGGALVLESSAMEPDLSAAP